MKAKLTYPVKLTKQEEGGYLVQFYDFPEGITQGETIKDSLCQALDCLQVVIAYRIDKKLDIPAPSKIKKARYVTLNIAINF